MPGPRRYRGAVSSSSAAVVVDELVLQRGPVTAVDEVSFTAASGAITVLLGPNGAGKTSTVEHLEGYLPRRSGTASVLGLDPSREHRGLSRRVGIMLQNGGIPTAIRPHELLEQYASFFEDSDDPEELLARVGLSAVSRTAYRSLSGGEQQRLSLALSLIGRPELLFLDEPTAGVDLEGRDLIRSLVRSLRDDGTTVFLTTHDLVEAEQLADKVLIIDRGRLVADGSPAELMSGAAAEHLHFGAVAGLDVDDLGSAIGATVLEVSPGEYQVQHTPTPELVASVTAWLAGRDLPLADLRAGRQRLEDVFRRLTTRDEPSDSALGDGGAAPAQDRAQKRGNGRRAGRGRR